MKTNQQGMTLIEVLVSGTIGAIVAGLILTGFSVEMASASESTATNRLLAHSQAVRADMGQSIREGNVVLCADETWDEEIGELTSATSSEIHVYDTLGAVVASYRIDGTNLQESTDGGEWHNFVVGIFAVNASGDSYFTLSDDRKRVELDLNLVTTYRGREYSLAMMGDMFRCRN